MSLKASDQIGLCTRWLDRNSLADQTVEVIKRGPDAASEIVELAGEARFPDRLKGDAMRRTSSDGRELPECASVDGAFRCKLGCSDVFGDAGGTSKVPTPAHHRSEHRLAAKGESLSIAAYGIRLERLRRYVREFGEFLDRPGISRGERRKIQPEIVQEAAHRSEAMENGKAGGEARETFTVAQREEGIKSRHRSVPFVA